MDEYSARVVSFRLCRWWPSVAKIRSKRMLGQENVGGTVSSWYRLNPNRDYIWSAELEYFLTWIVWYNIIYALFSTLIVCGCDIFYASIFDELCENWIFLIVLEQIRKFKDHGEKLWKKINVQKFSNENSHDFKVKK